jgi:hypothetical protein
MVLLTALYRVPPVAHVDFWERVVAFALDLSELKRAEEVFAPERELLLLECACYLPLLIPVEILL